MTTATRGAVTSPLIYSLTLPFVLLDGWVTLYQRLCFPLYRIPCVRRRDYIVFDRARLSYLTPLERANCAYCSYANGVIAYVREVAARTEQYWCPIKHRRRLPAPHVHYQLFLDYGDAIGYRRRLAALRRQLRTPDRPHRKDSRRREMFPTRTHASAPSSLHPR